MRSWLFSSLAFLGTMALNGCDQLGDDGQVQAASMVPQVVQAQWPQTLALQELVPNDEPLTGLDDTGDGDAKEIDWEALIPPDWRPEVLLEQYNADETSDDDPRAQQLLNKLKALWSQAPVVPALEGQLFDVVWVTGTMRVEHLLSDLAEAGYRLEDASVVPYE